jgi:hypothetical protein
MTISTPVAFLIFNRPELTEIVFKAIAQVRPLKLLVIADGPRFPEETEKCEKARAVIEKVDWDCQVLKNFSDVNLGCKRRVSSGLDWVFKNCEEAIILEDDCLPAPSFFYFCTTLLNKYRNDERVMMISGDNFQSGRKNNDYSYYFSKYTHIWGWASWRRSWQQYDVDLKTWPEYKRLAIFGSICEDPCEEKYWRDIFDSTFRGAIDTWDYQWTYACWSQNGLSIMPTSNLVSNIGFGPGATHTFGDSYYARLPTIDIWEIKHPPFVVRNRDADIYTFEYVLGSKSLKEIVTFRSKIENHLWSIRERIKLWVYGF